MKYATICSGIDGGTTGVACLNTGRRFIGMEKDPRYFQGAVDRITRELQQHRLPL